MNNPAHARRARPTNWRLSSRAGAALAVLVAMAGCSTVYPAYPVVPPPLSERVPKPPISPDTLSWRPGYYDWTGTGYVWRPGEWIALAGHGALWQDGYWRRTGERTYAWVPPGWK